MNDINPNAAEMTTGNPTCDAMLQIHLEGNIVPAAWFKTVVKHGAQKASPHLLAINILADVAYWYRPASLRDEETGQLIGYKKKFHRDLLQRNYKQISALFGCSTGQAKDAVRFLEELGVIKRVFRDVEVAGVTYNNVMYIALDPARLKELTYPSVKNPPEGDRISHRGVAGTSAEGNEKNNTPLVKSAHYTEVTSKISSKTPPVTSSIFPSAPDREMEHPEEKLISDKARLYAEIARQCELEFRRSHGFLLSADDRESARFPVYELAVDCLVEMCSSSSGAQIYLDTRTNPAEIWRRVQAIIAYDQSLCYFMEDVMESFIDASREKEIKNKRKYLKTMLWERLHTYIVRADER